MTIQKTFLILFVFVLASCGNPEAPTLTEEKGSTSPAPPDTPNPPDNPKQPDNDQQASPQVCYLQSSKGQTCFDYYDIDDANKVEAKYNYVDSFNDPSFPRGLDKWQYRSPVNLLFSSQHTSSAPLSKNFRRSEVLNSNDTRGHYGFFSPQVLERIQQMRDSFDRPLVINSGYRSPKYNSTLKGAAKFSRHTYGDAIDFKISGVSFQEIADRCLALGAGYYQIYSTHVHCDWRTTPLNETVYGEDLRPHFEIQTFQQVSTQLSANVSIQVSQLKAASKTSSALRVVSLSANEPPLEDGYGVEYNWQIYRGRKLVHSSSLQSPNVELKPGSYEVLVSIGGSVNSSKKIVVQ